MNTYEQKAMCSLKAFIVKKALEAGRQEKKEEGEQITEEKAQMTMNTYEEKAMCRLKAFIVKKALKGGRQEKKEEGEQITEEEKWEKEQAALQLKAQRTEMMLKRWDLMHKVVAHRLINKVPSTCPEEMRNRIPARAKEEEGVQMQHCEKKVVKKKSLFRRFLKLFRRDKTSESSKTTKMITPEPKEVAQQKKIEEKEMEEKKLEMEEKKLGMEEEKKVEKETTNTFTEEEKRKVEEEVEEKKKNERKVKAMRDRIQRVKLYKKMTDAKDPEKKRKLMQRLITHRIINKIGVPCTGQRRNSILCRDIPWEEKEEEQTEVQEECQSCSETTTMITPEPEEVAQQKETEEKEMEEKKLEMEEENTFTGEKKKTVEEEVEEKEMEKKNLEMEEEKEMEEKKLGMEEEKKVEKETTNTFTEEEKRKVEEEVEGKKKNERKVKAMRDRIQRVKLYTKMADTEDPEEKRKLMQQVITHRMINKIGVPCAGQRRNSILCRDIPWEEKEEEQTEVQEERQSCSTTTTLAIVNTNQESQEMPREEPKSMKHQEVATRRTELIKMSFDKDPAEARDAMNKVVAQRIINKVPSPCPKEMRYRIPARASELEEEDIQHFKNILHWSNSFREEEKEVQNENLIRDKTSKRKKTTIIITLEPKEVAQQKETEEKEIEEKKLEMEEEKKMEKETTNTFTEEEKRKVEEEVEGKKKNERKVKAMRDRIQRVKLYTKMTDTEYPEEKWKLMQQVITHRMINNIGVPCAGQRRNSILCTDVVREEKNKVQKTNKRENQV